MLHNLVDTLVSRNSDFEGYWFPGFLVSDSGFSIDLLETNEVRGEAPRAAFVRLAREKFADQLHKARLDKLCDRASLHLHRSDVQREWTVNGHVTSGYDLTLAAKATSDLGATYEASRTVWVAPHDPLLELRSVRR